MGMLYAHALPEMVSHQRLRGTIAVVIDLLRASTTMTTALSNGATAVVPVSDVHEAMSLRSSGDLLGGERGGVRIEGFDLGNSPREYGAERVAGHRVIFTTTNGTRAIQHARAGGATHIVIACFSNLGAAAELINRLDGDLHVLCAGTGGTIGMDDCVCAGALAAQLVNRADAHHRLSGDDQARMMIRLWDSTRHEPASILECLREARGGRELVKLGFEADVEFCAHIDRTRIVPLMAQDGTTLTVAGPIKTRTSTS